MKRKALVALAGLLLIVTAGLVFQGDIDASTLVASVKIAVGGTYANSVDLMTAESRLTVPTKGTDFTSGTGANQADKIFTDTRTLAASTAEDLDVAAGALTDAFGVTFTIAELKVLMVCAASANTNSVVLGGDANSVPFLSTAATTITIKPGGCFLFTDPSAAGVAVTGATGDIVQVANSGAGTSVTYDILMLGSSS